MDKKAALGARIKALRKQQGWSQEQLAERVGISTQYVSNIERGKENPTLDLLLRLAEALRVAPVDIFDFEAEGLDRKGIQTEVRKVIETQDVERLRIALRVLRAILR
ncbi:MAG: helix-turn-helix transcriptional regulator [Candidatus Rokubacteria bacterium]|nr:helix-turn-helix transcriptional regulator [Candidatus Rokubacteria bacterium]